MSKLTQTGDTIVEVMICLAIVGSALAAAYTISSRSLNGSRSSEERAEAAKLAEGQVEELKFKASTAAGWTEITSPATAYCYVGSPPTQNAIASFTKPHTRSSFIDLANDAFSDYHNCQINGLYNVSVVYPTNLPDPPNPPNADDLFIIRVRWNTLGSSNRSEVIQYYRVHQPN